MHAPFVFLAALAGLAVAGSATPNPKKVLVQFPESMLTNEYTSDRNKLNGYTYYARQKCLQLCGHQVGIGYYSHHQISVVPTRLANVAETSCWCCVKDANGDCFSPSNPYKADDIYGPWSDLTDAVVAKLKALDCTSDVTSAQVSAVKPPTLEILTTDPQPGQAIKFHWDGPKSEVGGQFYAFFINSNKTVKVAKLTDNSCTFPNLTGRIAITLSALKNPKASSMYQVARTTVTIGSSSKRLRRAVKHAASSH